MKIALVHSGSNPVERESVLAERLGLSLLQTSSLRPPAGTGTEQFDFYLQYDSEGLGLRSTAADAPGTVRVDFSDARLNYRVGNAARNQNIVKAIGIKGKYRPFVLDATAGLGKDAYLFASLGCEVQMLERSAVVHALLEDGLRLALAGKEELASVAERMHLQHADFLDIAADSAQFDVVYLDPMFPSRNKSAKVKKDMYLLQKLLGHEENSSRLLSAALPLARKRVVVKRGKLSPWLTSEKPDIEFKGSSSRYDVYLTH